MSKILSITQALFQKEQYIPHTKFDTYSKSSLKQMRIFCENGVWKMPRKGNKTIKRDLIEEVCPSNPLPTPSNPSSQSSLDTTIPISKVYPNLSEDPISMSQSIHDKWPRMIGIEQNILKKIESMEKRLGLVRWRRINSLF